VAINVERKRGTDSSAHREVFRTLVDFFSGDRAVRPPFARQKASAAHKKRFFI